MGQLAVAAPAGQPVPDLMEVAASIDVRATSAVQLAVTRAGDRLVSVGPRGTVLLSDDGGKTWRQARSVPSSVALTDVCFVNDKLGWAVGHSGIVLHSRDGGESWVRQLEGRQAAQQVLEEAQALAATGGREGAGRLLRDAQGMVEDGPDKPLLSVSFTNERRGYVVGAYGLALATEDGGQSWQAFMARLPNPRGKHLYQVRADGAKLLISGEQGALFHSDDAGLSFAEVRTPYPGTFFGVLSLAEDTVLAYGLRGNVWRSGDGGAAWTQIAIDQDITITSGVRLKDGAVVLADESGRLLRSDDQGRSFSALKAKAPNAVTALVQSDDGALVMSGARGLDRVDAARLVVRESR
uniref:Photosynthesis system II assembly factor Ycf48/Hcf136-like domain-containing protein n=2 Tax=Aromatoleum anaerobium TaxID=182180 RepID=A0ABX1PIL1_9RHOO